MKKIVLFSILLFSIASCVTDPAKQIKNNPVSANSIPTDFQDHQSDSGNVFNLTHPEIRYSISPRTKIDFRNFAYPDNYILKNGTCFNESPTGFDSLVWVATYKIEDSLYLVELYHSYGGGSSEREKKIYLYKRNHNDITLMSNMHFSGNFKSSVNGRELIASAEYHVAEDANCCPSKKQTGYFHVGKDKITCNRTEISNYRTY